MKDPVADTSPEVLLALKECATVLMAMHASFAEEASGTHNTKEEGPLLKKVKDLIERIEAKPADSKEIRFGPTTLHTRPAVNHVERKPAWPGTE